MSRQSKGPVAQGQPGGDQDGAPCVGSTTSAENRGPGLRFAPSLATSSESPRQFGENRAPLDQEFTFRSLHNISPVPPRKISPEASKTTAAFVFSTPSPTSRRQSSNRANGDPSETHLSPPPFSLPRHRQTASSSSTLDSEFRGLSLNLPAYPSSQASSTTSSPPPAASVVGNASPSSIRSDQVPNRAEQTKAAKVVEYDVFDEPSQSHEEFLTSDFQSALTTGLVTAKQAASALEKLQTVKQLDTTGLRLLREAQALSAFHGSDTRRIAILGDSGEGKSSVINSLLHFPGIAPTGDLGSACTSVVTEYRHKKPGQEAPIVVEAEFLTGAGIKDMISELVWSYRQVFHAMDPAKELSRSELERFESESDHAWSALHAAFQHEDEFSKGFLQEQSDGADERILARLLEWSEAIEWPQQSEATTGCWTSSATTAEECCEQTRVFMQDRLWPFTKIIRVYLGAQVLKTGAILADLPGLQDTNLARLRTTQNYLLSCDNIFIVANIARAITNQSIKSSLYNALSQHIPMEWEAHGAKKRKVAIVCTKTELIDVAKNRKTFCGPGKPISKAQLALLDKEIHEATEANDFQRRKNAKTRLKLQLMQARNSHVADGLQRVYASEVQGGELKVFFVANSAYEKYCTRGQRDFVQASGVPELRRFCHSITAASQLHEAKHLLQDRLPSLLNSMLIWCDTSLADLDRKEVRQNEQLMVSFDHASNAIHEAVHTVAQDYLKNWNSVMMPYWERLGPTWSEVSIERASSWESWHHSQYNAWCLHNGHHATAGRAKLNWNREIVFKMRMELAWSWEDVTETVGVVFERLKKDAVQEFESLRSIAAESSGQSPRHRLLPSQISLSSSSFIFKLDTEKRAFARIVELLQTRVCEANATSYILDEMRPSYRLASGQSGTGRWSRQKSIIRERVSDSNLYPNMAFKCLEEIQTAVRHTEEQLQAGLRELLEKLRGDFLSVSQTPLDKDESDVIKAFEDCQAFIATLKDR